MTESDSYNSIQKSSEGLFKDKGSKFLSFAFPVVSEDEIKEIISDIKKQYHNARHHCYAYKLGADNNNFRVNDDGEPSGTAGKPIYGQMLSNELSDILIVVVRYFGGVLLGTGGLINAYKNAAFDAIQNAIIIKKVVKEPLNIGFTYELMNPVMKIVKDLELDVLKQDFTDTCKLHLNVRLKDYNTVKERFEHIYGVNIIE